MNSTPPRTSRTAAAPASTSFLDRYFDITGRGSTVGTEIRGGLVTFVTMAYIVILNPLILSTPDVDGVVLESSAVATSTALTAGVMTILFGLVTRLPFAFAAGLGINAFVAFSVVGQVTWGEAMALVVINGLIIVLLAVTGLRKMIFDAVPVQLKLAITVGIGLFIAFIGFVNAGFVTTTGNASPPLDLGVGGSITTISTVMFVVTLFLSGILMALKVKGGLLLGLVGGTVITYVVNAIWPTAMGLDVSGLSVVAAPDFGLVGAIDFGFDWAKVGVVSVVMIVFTLVFSNFFDAMGTMTGLAKESGLANEKGDFPRIKSALIVEGVGAIAGGATSSSSATVFVESGSGIGEGARTGLANVVTGLLFLVAMFFTPLASIVPGFVAAAALVLVGALMLSQIKNIDLTDFSVLLPVFLTATVMPLTYSIANGIGAGFISWVVVNAFAGRAKHVHWLLWIVAAGFVLYFARGPIEALVGA
ncbi:NCS2 family permease [Microbacterium sp. EYE_5]|uniref:NCS2 family permease n=1 Tax=unclassified Microbacterium TaxID=2609290 RepID=UPI00200639D8|nr:MULTISPECIES: NCS2 family permease [unclassified Microbacterium]MCK6081686.1 NCS2 family permease [Microbacterium sp. EYE_382]MCK6086956.1 NCS2 family permease [Microbacterium sp. EYE_384]MCK6123546.1 NCS2 family permease [Microbacterium sp. EYE_80]MCK6126455.1 NCS2 family permease [Microbacterium sp. EYE_79]MCK6142640.1 NCS2 family permease [Microbacterium sp. EYE_39]